MKARNGISILLVILVSVGLAIGITYIVASSISDIEIVISTPAITPVSAETKILPVDIKITSAVQGPHAIEISNHPDIEKAIDGKRLGEIEINYPGMMEVNSSNFIYVSIDRLPEDVLNVIYFKLSLYPGVAVASPGTRVELKRQIIIDNRMRVEIDAPGLVTNTMYPAIHNDDAFPWVIEWLVEAPGVPGNRVFTIYIFIEDYDFPIWSGSYPINIVDPIALTSIALTGIPTATYSSTPTSAPSLTFTPSPTLTTTPSPTPTPSVGQRIIDSVIEGSDTILAALIAVSAAALASLAGVLGTVMLRKDRIRKLEEDLEKNPNQPMASQKREELEELKRIKWWQFWKTYSQKE